MKTILISILTVVSTVAFAGEPLVGKGRPSPVTKDTGTIACEEALGPNASPELLDSCRTSYDNFQAKVKLLQVAEMAKEKIAATPALQDKMKQVGAEVITQAKTQGALVTQGATVPDLAFDWGVGRIEEDGGVSCEAAYDFSQDDEFGEVVPGLYNCRIRGSVWINYSVKNMCEEFPTLKLEQDEQWIEFQINAGGNIDKSSIKTRPLLTIQDNCAG